MSFLIEYLKHPCKIGAVAPSSKYLAKKMVAPISFSKAGCIVEYGPGTGVFTEEIMKHKRENTIFLIIEQNEAFYLELYKKYHNQKNVYLCHGNADQVANFMKQYQISKVDYVVSGLPFASLPSRVSRQILKTTNVILRENGKFITFQYTLWKKKLFLDFFHIKSVSFEGRNLPPAFVLTMTKKERNVPWKDIF